ncbi:MAG: SpoIIE family protein phosphatase [Deltaproteobacteria bacterium]|nr:SpoIIE family protein phosphatase [Kofleriaceae bacterium]
MGPRGQDRPGIPLSVKLMLTTSIVVAAAVGASAYFGSNNIRELARSDAAARRASGNESIKRESELLASNIAAAAAIPLAQQAYGEVGPLVAAKMQEYPRIQWVVVGTPTGDVIHASDGAPTLDFADFPDTRVRPGLVERTQAAPERPEWIYATAIRLGDGVVGQLRMGVSTADLEAELAAALAAADRRADESTRTVWLVAIALLALGVVVAALLGISTGRPLRQLAVQADRIAQGSLDQRVPAGRRDEIGLLARNFNFMAERLGQLMVEQAQKVAMERELALARSVQQGMLPPPELVQHGHLKIVGFCEPASTCGGDWWTYRRLTGGRLLVVIGDATGHGMHSALLAGTARGAVEALAEVDEKLLVPEQVLKSIDAAIRNVGEHSLLMTAFAAVFDSDTGVVQYANAGQNFPYVMRMKQARTLGDSSIIAASGNPLGDRAVPLDIRRGTTQLAPGDLFVAFTDGLVERQAASGKLFGDRRLRSIFAGKHVPAHPSALTSLREEVKTTVETFAGGTVSQDDITFVLCQFDPVRPSDGRTGTSETGATASVRPRAEAS